MKRNYLTSEEVRSAVTKVADIGNKDLQEKLESAINIKTINGESVLGGGDLPVSGSGTEVEANPTSYPQDIPNLDAIKIGENYFKVPEGSTSFPEGGNDCDILTKTITEVPGVTSESYWPKDYEDENKEFDIWINTEALYNALMVDTTIKDYVMTFDARTEDDYTSYPGTWDAGLLCLPGSSHYFTLIYRKHVTDPENDYWVLTSLSPQGEQNYLQVSTTGVYDVIASITLTGIAKCALPITFVSNCSWDTSWDTYRELLHNLISFKDFRKFEEKLDWKPGIPSVGNDGDVLTKVSKHGFEGWGNAPTQFYDPAAPQYGCLWVDTDKLITEIDWDYLADEIYEYGGCGIIGNGTSSFGIYYNTNQPEKFTFRPYHDAFYYDRLDNWSGWQDFADYLEIRFDRVTNKFYGYSLDNPDAEIYDDSWEEISGVVKVACMFHPYLYPIDQSPYDWWAFFDPYISIDLKEVNIDKLDWKPGIPEGGSNGDVLTKVNIPAVKKLKDSYTYEELEAFYGDLEVDDYKGIYSDDCELDVHASNDFNGYELFYYRTSLDINATYYCSNPEYEDGWYDQENNKLDHAPELFIPDDLTEEDFENISDVSEMDVLFNIAPAEEKVEWKPFSRIISVEGDGTETDYSVPIDKFNSLANSYDSGDINVTLRVVDTIGDSTPIKVYKFTEFEKDFENNNFVGKLIADINNTPTIITITIYSN